jgi:hypothetical protein
MARFAYYDRLDAASKRTYRASDAILRIEVPGLEKLRAHAVGIEPALAGADRAAVERACQAIVDGVNAALSAPPAKVRVLERRPSSDWGELHGLYEPDEVTGGVARITLWMRTASKEKVVAFRTFLRTLTHELCHHLDYEHFKLPETFHTQGFYARESAMVRELLGEKSLNADERR